ncbi:hypothetical protein LguiA_031868 [Lonicera macranthoides]
MEAFSLLKFRRTSSAGEGTSTSTTTTTSSTASDLRNHALESDEEESFFDLVFTRRNRKFNSSSRHVQINNSSDNDDEQDSCKNSSKRDCETKSNFFESPNQVFYKRKISHIESHSKNLSLLRSPHKFKVLMLGFKKSKLDKTETDTAPMPTPKLNCNTSSVNLQSNRFNVKCQVEEFPISSLFTRDKSLRSQLDNERSEESQSNHQSKRFLFQKYLNLIKPMYVRVSKRYSVKTKLSDQLPAVSPFSSPATAPMSSPAKQVEEKQGSRVAVFREVCKSLVKSRSTSSAVGIMPLMVSRRDDSVQQQEDGIQSAILHCKRSYSSSSSSQDYSMLSRSASNSSQEKSINLSTISIEEEEKRSSI